ncbi:MAG: hypothetical protein EAZ19_05150, partial [Oscillatoriales cyanobacterium]
LEAHPTKIFFLVGWASSPSQNLVKRIFARGLLYFSCLLTKPTWEYLSARDGFYFTPAEFAKKIDRPFGPLVANN